MLYYYTYDQVNAFCEAAYENEKESLNNSCISARVAYHAKNQDFKDFVKIDKKPDKSEMEKEVAKFRGGYKIGKKKVKNANR